MMNYTLRHAVRRAYEKNINDVQGWAFRRYPGFILSDQVQRLQEIPVFVFHQVTRHWLEPLLQFLAANGYRTLTGDELYTRLMSGTLGHERQVVLTFDDGHKSLWTVAYPLLRQYGLKAIAFIVPALVPAQADGTAWGRAAEELCTWSELRTMQQAGVIDCQAHSLYHHTIYISPRIIGYISPSHQVLSLAGDLFPVLDEDNTRRLPSDLPLGTPLYASAPRLSGRRRYLDSPGLRRACADFVDHQGGARFFEAPQWRERLDQFVRRVWSSFRHETRFETQAERRAAIRLDLSRSQYLLEEKLAGQPVRHFCFPWYIGDRLPVEIAGELGYQTNFWGGLAPRFTQAYPRPLPIPRLDPLYIWRLPGQGRQSVRQILQQRVGQLTKMRGSP